MSRFRLYPRPYYEAGSSHWMHSAVFSLEVSTWIVLWSISNSWLQMREASSKTIWELVLSSTGKIKFMLMLSYQKALSLRQLGSLSKGVFERRTSTGSEVFFILKHLDAPKFVFLSVLTIIETSCPKRWAKPLSKNEKRPLPVDVRRSKTSLLKFTIEMGITRS